MNSYIIHQIGGFNENISNSFLFIDLCLRIKYILNKRYNKIILYYIFIE